MDPRLNLGLSCRLVALFRWPLQPDKLCMESCLFGVCPSPSLEKNKISTIQGLFYPIYYLKRLLENPSKPSSWLPLLFISIAFLALVGGTLYPPSNYDALSYRLPRILHWLDLGHWHWIDSPNTRQNYSSPDLNG